MRGFLRGLGFNGSVASPTYALEQRYATVRGDVVHIDLYRLEPAEVAALLRESDGHEGIRCVEWPEKAGEALRCDIAVQIAEERGGTRTIDITLDDVAIPSDELIAAWRTELRLPKNVAKHCDVVGEACRLFAEAIAARGIVVRPNLARAAGPDARSAAVRRLPSRRSAGGPRRPAGRPCRVGRVEKRSPRLLDARGSRRSLLGRTWLSRTGKGGLRTFHPLRSGRARKRRIAHPVLRG
jgi:hypothetical protein